MQSAASVISGGEGARSSEWEVLDDSDPMACVGGLGHELKIADVLADRGTPLMTEHKTSEGTSGSLPVLRQGLEANVLREQHAPEGGSPVEQILIAELIAT